MMIQAVQRALDSVTDDTALDWTALEAESLSDPDVEGTLRALQEIAAIARAFNHPAATPATPPFRWGPLDVRDFIARGAHGDVYRAWDPRLERDVALKLLRSTTGDTDPHVSIAEGRLLAKVRHPNVVAVYGADRVNGEDGIWMDLVEGRTLREAVESDGPMPAADAARVAAELCDGLAAIHTAGLIHRDVKAQNVIVDRSGRTILMDLGAGLDENADAQSKEGTPIYLAPELLEGGAPSRASDIYAAGVLMFFLVTGRYPVMATTIADLRDAHRRNRRERLSDLRVVPPRLAAVVDRALAPAPADRFTTASELALALRAAASTPPRRKLAMLGAAAALAAVAGALVWTAASVREPSAADRAWVLIAPFENFTGDPQFTRSIDAALSHELSASSSVNVVPAERLDDALRLMRHDPSAPFDERVAREAAQRDGQIRFVAAGAVSRAGSGYALSVRLVEPSTGATVSSRTTEFAAVSEVGEALRSTSEWLRATVRGPGAPSEVHSFEKGTTRSLEAFRLFADALRSARVGRWAEADAALTAAIALDPQFASAHAWKSWTATNLGRTEEGRASAKRALSLAETVSARERAFIRATFFIHQQEPARALAELEAMVRRYPDDYWASHKLGQQYTSLGRMDDFREVAVRLLSLRPRDIAAHSDAVRAVILTRGPAAAEPFIEPALRLRRELANAPPTHETGYLDVLPVHLALSAFDTAKATALLDEAEAAARDDEPDVHRFRRASLRMAMGQLQRAEQGLARVRNEGQRRLWMSFVHLMREDTPALLDSIRGYQGFDYAAVSMLVRAGDTAGARSMLDRIGPRDQRNFRWAGAEIDVATTNTRGARQLLREGADVFRRITGVRAFLYAETLADGYWRAGDRNAAIEVLEQLTPLRDRLYALPGSNVANWIRTQKMLADFYRQEGRADLAAPLERQILDLLRSADPGHPIAAALRVRF